MDFVKLITNSCYVAFILSILLIVLRLWCALTYTHLEEMLDTKNGITRTWPLSKPTLVLLISGIWLYTCN